MMTIGQIRTLVNVRDFSYEDLGKLDTHRRNVDTEFWPKTWHGEQGRIQQLGQITNDWRYKAWHESKSSGLFILSGKKENDRVYNCWACYMALGLVQERMTTDTSTFHLFGH